MVTLRSVVCVLATGLLVGASFAFVPAAAGPSDDPTCSTTLTLPQSALELRLDHRQIGPDLSRYQEPEGVDAIGLHQLQVMSHLAQGQTLKTGVTLRAGGHTFKPASYRMGFTVTLGGALHFFLADGIEAIQLPSVELEPGWSTERLAMHLEYATRTDVRLVWHLGTKAGSISLGLGASGPAPAAPAVKPPEVQPQGTKPQDEQPEDGGPRDG